MMSPGCAQFSGDVERCVVEFHGNTEYHVRQQRKDSALALVLSVNKNTKTVDDTERVNKRGW